MVLGIELRALHILGKYAATEHLKPRVLSLGGKEKTRTGKRLSS